MATTYAIFSFGDPLMADYIPVSDVLAGDVIVIGQTLMIAHGDIATGRKGALAAGFGVYDMPKASGGSTAIAAGTTVFWDATNHRVTATQTAGVRFGIVVADSLDADTAVRVLHLPATIGEQAFFATLTPAQGSANVCLVTIQVKKPDGSNVTVPVDLIVTLSDAATGAGLTATTASGAVAAGASGTDLSALVAKKALLVKTDATGKYILSITDTVKTGFYVVAAIPGKNPNVSAQLVTGNYG